jgi:hypothetical protein
MGLGDLLREREEVDLAVAWTAGVPGDIAVATTSAANRMVMP